MSVNRVAVGFDIDLSAPIYNLTQYPIIRIVLKIRFLVSTTRSWIDYSWYYHQFLTTRKWLFQMPFTIHRQGNGQCLIDTSDCVSVWPLYRWRGQWGSCTQTLRVSGLPTGLTLWGNVLTHWSSDPKSKEDKIKVTNFENLPKIQILQQTLHATHFLKLLDKMHKYEMDPASTVEDGERTWFRPQTPGQTDERTARQRETNIPPSNFVEARGMNIKIYSHGSN